MKVHILVVDDDEIYGRLLCKLVDGSEIISADSHLETSSEQAFAYASQEGIKIDICLIDQQLDKGSDGISLINSLKAYQPDTDFIMITGQIGHENFRAAYSSGIYSYLRKPIERPELEWTLKSLIERRRARRERSWNEIILDIANNSFSANIIEDLAALLVSGGVQLGFKRARFWQCFDQKTLKCIAQKGHDDKENILNQEIDALKSVSATEAINQREATFFNARKQREESPVYGLFSHKIGEWAALPIWIEDHCEALLALDFGDEERRLSIDEKRLLMFLNGQANASLAQFRQRNQSIQLHLIKLSNKEAEITRRVQEAALNVHHLAEEDPYRLVIKPLIEGVTELLDIPTEWPVCLLLRRRQIDKFGNHEDVQVDFIVRDGKLKQFTHKILEEGVSGDVFRTGRREYVKDSLEDLRYYQGELKKDITTLSELDVPIFDVEHDIVIGVWNIEATKRAAFSDYQISALERFSKVTSSILQSFKRINRVKKQLVGMQNVTSDAPIEETMQALGDTIYDALPSVDTITIWHKHRDEDPYKAQCGYRRGLKYPEEISPTATHTVIETIRRKKPHYIIDTHELPEHEKEDNEFIDRENIRTNVQIPLRSGNESIGALLLGYRNKRNHSDEEIMFIQVLSEMITANIRESIHRKAVEDERERLKNVMVVINAVLDTFDQTEALTEIVKQLKNIFEESTLAIYLLDIYRNELLLLPESKDYGPNSLLSSTARALDVNDKSAGLVSEALRKARKNNGIAVINADDVTSERYEAIYYPALPDVKVALASAVVTPTVSTVLIIESKKPTPYTKEQEEFVKAVIPIIASVLSRGNQKRKILFANVVASRTAWATEIAHEGKSEIGLIRNRVDWVYEDIKKNSALTEVSKNLLLEIDNHLGYLSQILTDPAQGGLHLVEKELYNLFDYIVDSTEIILNKQGPLETVLVQYEFPDASPYTAQPRIYLFRMLRYLINNSLEAFKNSENPNPRLLISAELLEKHPNEAQEITISIYDNGPGIPSAIRSRLFYERTTGSKSGSRGFGLLFAKMIAQGLDGDMWLDSGINEKGTRITFIIPLYPKEERDNHG